MAGTRPFLNAGSVTLPVPLGKTIISLLGSASERDFVLITISAKRRADAIVFDLVTHSGPAQISLAFMALPRGQVAGPGRSMLDLALGRQAETFLCALMGLNLRHNSHPSKEYLL